MHTKQWGVRLTAFLFTVFFVALSGNGALAATTYTYVGSVDMTYYMDTGDSTKPLSRNISLAYNNGSNKAGYNIFKARAGATTDATFFVSNKNGVAQIEPGPGNSIFRLRTFTTPVPAITSGSYKTAALNVIKDAVYVIYDSQYDIYVKVRVTKIGRATRRAVVAKDSVSPITNSNPAPALKSVPVATVLAVPRIISPSTNQVIKPAFGSNRKVELVWTAVSGAESYVIENNYKRCIDSMTSESCWYPYDMSYTVSAAETNNGATNNFSGLYLGEDATFRVRIRAVDKNGKMSGWSSYAVFKVDTSVVNVAQPKISLPVSGQVFTDSSRSVTFQWGWVQGVTEYQAVTECASVSNPSNYQLVADDRIYEILWPNASVILLYDGTCRTRVRGYSDTGSWGQWSDYVTFTVDTSGSQSATVLQTKPTITMPTAGASYSSGYVKVAWTKTDGAARYSINLSCETCSVDNPWWNIKQSTDLSVLLPVSDFAPGLQTYTAMVTPILVSGYDGTMSNQVTFTVQK